MGVACWFGWEPWPFKEPFMSRFSIAAVLAASAADGIPAVQGGPRLAMSPGMADAAIIDAIRVSSK